MKKIITTAAMLVAASLALSGCSGGGARDAASQPQGQSTSASAPVSASPDTTTSDEANFENAIKFTKLSFRDEHDEAKELVAPDSPASKFLHHQQKHLESLELEATNYLTSDFEFKPDRAKRQIKIIEIPSPGMHEDPSGREPEEITHVWSAFQHAPDGKIISWTHKWGPIEKSLWSKPASDQALGLKATLVSAYHATNGNLTVITNLKASRKVEIYGATYVPAKGYRKDAIAYSSAYEFSKGDRYLAYFQFKKSEIGGKIRIEVTSESSYGDHAIELTIK
jgi:hypothetical protein